MCLLIISDYRVILSLMGVIVAIATLYDYFLVKSQGKCL